MAGLASAWFLQEAGVDVTVVDRTGVAAGASWGNAGWLTPALAVPLPEPGALKLGLRTFASPTSPVSVPLRADPRLALFLLGFTRNCTHRHWHVSLAALTPLSLASLTAYDELASGGVPEPTRTGDPFLVALTSLAARRPLTAELESVRAAGQDVSYDLLTGAEARELEPALSPQIRAAVLLHGQRHLRPGPYVCALAESVRQRGGKIVTGVEITRVRDTGAGVTVSGPAGMTFEADAVVLAPGAWLNRLAAPFGVRVPVQSGRGYSFTVAGPGLPSRPAYFAERRVVCTPYGERVRVSGTMEFTSPDRPADPRRFKAIAAAARELLPTADLEQREDEWVGPRPCTADGLPLIGPTRSPRVFVCGGHGMWGIALGPVSGKLLAEGVVSGRWGAEVAALHPLR